MGSRVVMAALMAIFFISGPTQAAAPLGAQNFRCEILSVKGQVTASGAGGTPRRLLEGDLVAAGEILEVTGDGYIDVSYDRDWNNVLRIESNSKATLTSIAPSRVDLEKGAILARLRSLPAESQFEIRTPASSTLSKERLGPNGPLAFEYRVALADNSTQIFNFSPGTLIFVFSLDPKGSKLEESLLTLGESNATDIAQPGDVPSPPQIIVDSYFLYHKIQRQEMESNVDQALRRGRRGKIQSTTDLGAYLKELERSPKPDSGIIPIRR